MNRTIKKNIAGFCLASFFSDWCHEMGTVLLPTFIVQLVGVAYAPMMLGTIQGISDAFATVMKLLSGYISDHIFYYKPFLIVCYGLMGFFVAIIGTAQTIWAVLLYKSMAWIFRGFREPMRDTWLSKIVAPALYGRAFGLHRAWDTLGALIGPVCVFFLLKSNYSMRFIFMSSLIPAFFSVIMIIWLTNEKKEQIKKNKLSRFSDQIKALPSDFNYFVGIMLFFGCANFNHTLILYRIQTLLSTGETFSAATSLSVLLYAFFNIIRGLSELGIGALSDYINRKIILALLGFGLFGVTSICCMATTQSLWFWLLVFACAGISIGTVKVLEKAHASYILPENVRGTGLGLLQAVDGVGDLVSSCIVGLLWTFFSPEIAFGYSALLSFIAMIIFAIKK